VTLSAAKLSQLLSKRHSVDLVVDECKDGPTIGRSHFRMDVWVMKRSWSRPTFWGYEIKISRSDFLRDNKWQDYLGLCNQFYFVSPADVIKPDEVPEVAGLLWCSKNGTRLMTKKKAPHRDCDPKMLERVFRYVLMSRCAVLPRWNETMDPSAWWHSWMENKKLDHDFGHRVSKAIRETVRESIDKVEVENHRLKRENEEFVKIRALLLEMGIENEIPSQWTVRSKLAERIWDKIPRGMKHNLDAARRNLEVAIKVIDEIEERGRESNRKQATG